MTWLAVALGGGLGAAARYGVSLAVRRRLGEERAWLATFLVNLVGSMALGWLVGADAAAADQGWGAWHVVVGAGVLGGFTTFSAASLEAAESGAGRGALGSWRGIVHAVAMAVVSVGAGGLGLMLA
ncbi:MAG: CrcB family protein [Bifidobacteriaceae bacterium]|jgi:CrcB protein|nr:CrcB family protein [Bifidobacteriaceae bacterium]